MHPESLPTPTGELVATLLLRRLDEQGLRTSVRRMIDYLPPAEGRQLFDALIQLTDGQVDVHIPDDAGGVAVHVLQAIGRDPGVDIIPYLVVDRPTPGLANVGTEGFASALRDHYAALADRPRALVVITPRPNETQRSAQEASADRSLLDLGQLLQQVLDDASVPSRSPLRQVARVYCAYTPPQTSWSSALHTFQAYVDEAASAPPAEQGHLLPMLGCFLPDRNDHFHDGDAVLVLEEKDQKRRKRGDSRLHDNALLNEYLREKLADPLTDAETLLTDIFEEDPDKGRRIAAAGESGLPGLDLSTFDGLGQRKMRREKNSFKREECEIVGAAFHRMVTRADQTMLVITAPAAVEITFGLGRGFNPRKEHAQIATSDGLSHKLSLGEVSVRENAQKVTFHLTPKQEFGVFRLALTGGKRSVSAPHDSVLVALYRGSTPEGFVEEGWALNLLHQAWAWEGAYRFDRLTERGSEPATTLPPDEDVANGDDDAIAQLVAFTGTDLCARVVEAVAEDPKDPEDSRYDDEPLLELACTTHRRGNATTQAMRRKPMWLDAVEEIHEALGRYRVDLGTNTREVWAHTPASPDPFRNGQATAWLLTHPTDTRVTWQSSARVWQGSPTPSGLPPAVQAFLDARATLMGELAALAVRRVPRFRRVPDEGAVPLFLLPLQPLADLIRTLIDRWLEAADAVTVGDPSFHEAHDVLLQTDTLRVIDPQGEVDRLVVLPTHPWLLAALLSFQERFQENLRRAQPGANPVQGWRFELGRDEVQQLIPRGVIEDWYVHHDKTQRLRATDGAPFHLEFVRDRTTSSREPLDYVAQVVATKVHRYLGMHPHLRDPRRTLRIGFVHPASGRQLLDGLKRWLRDLMRQHADRIRDLPMETIPTVEVLLFGQPAERGFGAAFDAFFQQQVSSTDDDTLSQALMARLQYRFCDGPGPSGVGDGVHICFVHGLVDPEKQQPKTGRIDAWWDGAFGDGLLATWLRRTTARDRGALASQRGLWVDRSATGLRAGLARLLALHRGCRDGDLSLDKATYWETPLPDLRALKDIYENADWVVHLDRELSLEVFRQGGADDVTIIEYSDQEVPENPGFDTITATRNAAPYREQLGEILSLANLDAAAAEHGVPKAAAQRSAERLLSDLNVLSGSWALDFLRGSIADQPTSTRLQGNIGAALVYRWMRRTETRTSRGFVKASAGPVVPVVLSLEDLLRAAPTRGRSSRPGLVRRNRDAKPEEDAPGTWCDDLLVLYLTETQPGEMSRIFGRVIEVKFGGSVTSTDVRDKAVSQVKQTHRLLREWLGGSNTSLDAPFRHKQLSLLLKAQLEQAVAMGVLDRSVYEALAVQRLSANLAVGNYTVDYTIGVEDQQLVGDVFRLATDLKGDRMEVDIQDGVRIITLPRGLVSWLAFNEEDGGTLHTAPPNTLPHLGPYASANAAPTLFPPHVGPTSDARPIPAPPPPTPVSPPPAAAPALPLVPPSPSAAPALPSVPPSPPAASPHAAVQPLREASAGPIKTAPYADADVVTVVQRLDRALIGHKVRISASPSARETDRGPRLLRVYVRLDPGESIQSLRRASEDIARVVGTTTSDIHISNVPERHAVAVDLPVPGLQYAVTFDELAAHPSFAAAARELRLGFCAGIDVTGRAVWVDLATMPHMLVAGTTGSGKTVFLRNVILTLLLQHSPRELVLRLSSSKPMDFRIFTQAPHTGGRDMAKDHMEAKALADELVVEMERRYALINEAFCDNLAELNQERPHLAQPYIVAVFDEYAEMIASFVEKAEREAFEGAMGRLAQKARAAGIHLIVCMQRPDANALKGAIKANILHRFALKLPQLQDSRIILDENGAETLLGQGDLLYKDANSKLFRLQVPSLENPALRAAMGRVVAGPSPAHVEEREPAGEPGAFDPERTSLVEWLQRQGLEVDDRRAQNGKLWVLGEPEPAGAVLASLEQHGLIFRYAPHRKKGPPGWWMEEED